MLTCSHTGVLLRHATMLVSHQMMDKGPEPATYCKVGILCAQNNDVNHAIEMQTKIGWLHMFRDFVSIDWGHANMEADLVPNPSKNMHAYLNQV
jgi:hypothetical protein